MSAKIAPAVVPMAIGPARWGRLAGAGPGPGPTQRPQRGDNWMLPFTVTLTSALPASTG